MKFLRELVLDLLGELGFRVASIAWFLLCVIGLGVLGGSLGYHPRYWIYAGIGLGLIVPLIWWGRRELAEQRKLSE